MLLEAPGEVGDVGVAFGVGRLRVFFSWFSVGFLCGWRWIVGLFFVPGSFGVDFFQGLAPCSS